MSETSAAGNNHERLHQALAGVGAALSSGDSARAIAIARQALEAGLMHPALLNLRALSHEEAGRLQEALADLLRAEEIAPRDFTVQNAKGILLARLQRPHEALAAFETAIALSPRFAQAHHNRGWAREAVGDASGARQSYEQAFALNPDYAAPLAHLAALAVRMGDANRARVHAEQALRIDPSHAQALVNLADAERLEGEFAVAEARLRDVISRMDVLPMDRALALGVLGDLLDANGRYSEAFEAYSASKAGLREVFAPMISAVRSEGAAQMLLWLIDYFSKARPEVWCRRAPPTEAAAGEAQGHVFLIGFPLSGSSLLEDALALHPSVVMSRNRDLLVDAARDFMADTEDLDYLAGASDEKLDAHRRAYWRRVRETGVEPSGKVFIDSQPLYSMKLPLIARLFPAAKVVLSLRDPRDIVLDCFRRRFQVNASLYEFLTLDGIAVLYDLVTRFSLICLERLELAVGLVRYEDIVSDFDTQIRVVSSYLGIEWTAGGPGVSTPQRSSTGAGAEQQWTGRWRDYAPELTSLREILDPWVNRFGYPPA